MELTDAIGIRGVLRICVKDARSGLYLRKYEIRNKITFLMADVLVELLAQRATDPTPVFDSAFSMRMGISNTPASRSDTNLGAFVIGKQLLDVNKVTGVPGEIQFLTQLASGDANGNTLQEAGLFTQGSAGSPTPSDAPGTAPGTPRLFARQIHPPIPKSPAVVLDYDWRIAFVA